MAKETKNKNLHQAKKAKNDEFYTQLSDVEKELRHYREHFKDKVVFCNCDDARESAFFKYFSSNFEFLGLKRLITVGYQENGHGLLYVYEGDKNGNGIIDPEELDIIEMQGNGDFRSEESIAILQDADIVVTNPPFSLFREYVAQLIEYNKKFLVIGNMNAITYKEIFPLIKENKLWLGATCFNGGATFFKTDKDKFDKSRLSNPKHAYEKDGDFYMRVNGVRWFTNLSNKETKPYEILYKKYNPEEYPKYDNYDAINVDKVTEIPYDYDGVIGVPISFLDKWAPNIKSLENGNVTTNDFEIVEFRKGADGKDLVYSNLNGGGAKLSHTSEYSSVDANRGINEQPPRHQSEWEEQICENSYSEIVTTHDFEIIGCADADVVPNEWKGMDSEFIKLYYEQGNTGAYKEGNRLTHYVKNGRAFIPYKRILIRRISK